MNKYNDLELAVLSCLLQKNELMKQVILEDKHFKKHLKIWLFMKSFYNKFGNFDLTMMMSISKNKYRLIEYIIWLLEKEPAPSLFNDYQKQLIELYEKEEKEKVIVEKIFGLANDLYVGNVALDSFKNEIERLID